MISNDKNIYSIDFFQSIQYGSNKSAAIMVPFLVKLLQPKRVIDFGCGDGTWLKQFLNSGADSVLGIDGTLLPFSSYQIPREFISTQDLNKPFEIKEHYDLALCLEVAEHLLPETSDLLINELTKFADIILFGAAIPGQGGNNHINEQWPEYWIEKFSQRGYSVFDIIRSFVWKNPEVEWWYSQNTFLYVSNDWLIANPEINEKLLSENKSTIFSIVHPSCFHEHIRYKESQIKRLQGDDWPLSKVINRLPFIIYNSFLSRLKRLNKK
jgi:SAM-dependent methyltransferase